jgi:hypothetical protein
MNEKLQFALSEVDSERERIRNYDLQFQFTDEDHVWPKLHNSRSSCRCAIHNHADGLMYSCYVRIRQAQGGLPLRSALEMAEQLEQTKARAEARR